MSRMTREQIDKAEAAGIISPKQARSMRADLLSAEPGTRVKRPTRANRQAAVIGDEDDLRFLRSFGDVFIGLGLVLLGLGAAAVVGMMGGGLAWLGAAVGAALLAEWFGRAKRAHFPTLITALAFLFFVQKGMGALLPDSGVVAATVTAGAMALFYARIRLPFCVALIAVALLYLLFAALGSAAPDLLAQHLGAVFILSGLLIFALALLYDAQDRHRRTRFSDVAFWLHLLAAPLIIHGLVGSAVMGRVETLFGVFPMLTFSEADALITLAAFAVVVLVGLAINRRALIVSSLVYLVFAVAFLLRGGGLGFGATAAVTLVIVGALVVLLGVAWHPVRGLLIRLLPRWRVFPPPFEPPPA